MGKRVNEPARDFWFVPGGRIYKDESLDNAFSRICQSELGVSLRREKTDFYALYEHFMPIMFLVMSFSTHYVVLVHQVHLNSVSQVNDQHKAYRWFNVNELLERDDVHQYTKSYFKKEENR